MSKQFKEYCDSENIQHLVKTTGVPRGNGQVERIHKLVKTMLSKLCHENPTHWYSHIDKVQRIINDTEPRSTKVTPFEILTGVKMRSNDFPDLRQLLYEVDIEELN